MRAQRDLWFPGASSAAAASVCSEGCANAAHAAAVPMLLILWPGGLLCCVKESRTSVRPLHLCCCVLLHGLAAPSARCIAAPNDMKHCYCPIADGRLRVVTE